MNHLLLAAAVAQAFNLNCTGTFSFKDTPFSYVYRIDLSKEKWCVGECHRTFDFVEVSPSRLTFTKERKHTLSGSIFTITYVDRVTGEYESFRIWRYRGADDSVGAWTGRCERAPFTGLPRVTPKF